MLALLTGRGATDVGCVKHGIPYGNGALREAINRGGDKLRQAAMKDERLRRLLPAS